LAGDCFVHRLQRAKQIPQIQGTETRKRKMTADEERKLLIAALQYANSKFLGSLVAMKMIRDGEGYLDIDGAIHSLSEGNTLTGGVLSELVGVGEVMTCSEIDRALGDRLVAARRDAESEVETCQS
jgi:hypothetical protein